MSAAEQEEKTLTLFETNLKGVWVDKDCVSLIGLGESCIKSNKLNDDVSHKFVKRQQISKDYQQIPALRQQYGCFARKSIKIGKNLGFYKGHIYTKTNYEKYGQSNKEDFTITTHDCEQRPYVIEPFDDNMPLQFINDGKKGCSSNLCNVEFQEGQLFGIPLIQVVTIKNINKNEQLFVDYGDQYWNSRKGDNVKNKENKITETILFDDD